MKIETVTIIGAGALGILFGDICSKVLGPEKLCFLADERRVARYQEEGLYCNGRPCACSFSTSQEAKPADLVVFAVKAGGLEEATQLAAPAVGEQSILISLLNGVSSEERIGRALGMEKIIHTVAQGMDAVRQGNELHYNMPGELRLGYPPQETEKEQRLKALTNFLDRIGYAYVVEEDIQHRLWCKLMMNVGVNQCCMVYDCDYGGLQRPGKARETMLAAMEEVRQVAKPQGIMITDEQLGEYLALLDTLTPEGMPSMRQDALAKRPSEVDLFSGTLLAYAKTHNVPCPVNQMLWESIREMEAGY